VRFRLRRILGMRLSFVALLGGFGLSGLDIGFYVRSRA
jgi:hypothetical protein